MDSTQTEINRQNPRQELIRAIQDNDAAFCLHKTAEIHGHFCPGIALGVMASLYGLKHPVINYINSDGFEDFIAIIEINACFADGIQMVTGCTLGNNSLIYRDLGKHAVTLALRYKEEAVRIRVRPDFQALIKRLVPQFYPLLQKVIANREASAEDEAQYMEKARQAAFCLIKQPFEELLIADIVRPRIPDYAPIKKSCLCSSCQEQVMSSRTIIQPDGAVVCYSCASKDYYQVEGKGICQSS